MKKAVPVRTSNTDDDRPNAMGTKPSAVRAVAGLPFDKEHTT